MAKLSHAQIDQANQLIQTVQKTYFQWKESDARTNLVLFPLDNYGEQYNNALNQLLQLVAQDPVGRLVVKDTMKRKLFN